MSIANLSPPSTLLVALLVCIAACAVRAADGPLGVERVARLTSPGYQSAAASDDETRWLQVDLGRAVAVERVKLFPLIDWSANSQGFPARFRLQLADDPAFASPHNLADRTTADYPDPGDVVAIFPGKGESGRYLRLTATRLRGKQLALTKLEVWSGGKDAAEGCPVTDSVRGNLGKTALTRAPRPQGEGVVTDHPENVIPASQWKPVAYRAQAPVGGVTLGPGPFRTAMENNIAYLLKTFSVDEMLRPFRERAGEPVAPGLPAPVPFWDTDLPGSSAGRFLMGAGNSYRWIKDPKLCLRLDAVVNGIAECRRADGYLMAYPENTIFHSERAAYTRSWVTHGLIEAGYAGNPKAFDLLRGYYDWFDRNPYLPELLRRGGQGVQGMIANTRVYFTPAGKPEDLQVIQRYFQENYWLEALAKRDPRAIWQYPYDHPHCYLLTSIEPYLDLYRATGARKYLEAAQGGWELYHEKWEHTGGSIAICEGDSYPPGSLYLHRHTGELCGSVFFARLSQRFHLLYPDQEKYPAEIEKAIYNVALANQDGDRGLRYHANLLGKKDPEDHHNTCCEGQGTRLIGSIPEYLYSVAPDGLYVDLYAPSAIEWKQGGKTLKLETATDFPFSPGVEMRLSIPKPARAALRLRVPGWAIGPMPVSVNGRFAGQGKPGSYLVLDRTWSDGDRLTFSLPVGFRITRYEGAEQDRAERYALEYGPVVMALLGRPDDKEEAHLAVKPEELVEKLQPVEGRPLHFAVRGEAGREYVPYWEVRDELFTCYPFVGTGTPPRETVSEDDLALASKGATATSDSEYAREPGGTAKAIDGLIATPGDFSNRWHSSLETAHPHWIQVNLPKPEKVARIVVRFADPAGHPTSFQGLAILNGKQKPLFDIHDYTGFRRYEVRFPAPVTFQSFRFVIRESANPAYLNAAQVSEVELYAR